MTATVVYDPRLLTGYHMEELAAAFDRIRDPHDWKAPIAAEIRASDRHLVEMAVLWFTNTVPRFSPGARASSRLQVTAAGYRGGPFGDDTGRLHPEASGIHGADPWDLNGPIPGR